MGGGISEDDKNTLIDLHNKYRQKVASGGESEGSPGPQPAASSMPDLVICNCNFVNNYRSMTRYFVILDLG